MTCESCGDKPKKCNNDFTRAVVEINNPEESIVLLRKVSIPASIGDETVFPPANGRFSNVILFYEINKHVYIYSSDGIPTLIESAASSDVDQRISRLEAEDVTLHEDIRAEATTRGEADDALSGRVSNIEEVIPSAATVDNQLADKSFVNSSVATNTGSYISDNGSPFASLADLEAYSGDLANNDYAFVLGTDQQGNVTYTRYKYVASTETWAEEYVLNNSSFTSDQWASINSGITSEGVTKLSNMVEIKTIGDNLSLDENGELSAASIIPVQTTGQSTTDIMSQKAVTDAIDDLITMTDTDPGEGSPLAAGKFIAVY